VSYPVAYRAAAARFAGSSIQKFPAAQSRVASARPSASVLQFPARGAYQPYQGLTQHTQNFEPPERYRGLGYRESARRALTDKATVRRVVGPLLKASTSRGVARAVQIALPALLRVSPLASFLLGAVAAVELIKLVFFRYPLNGTGVFGNFDCGTGGPWSAGTAGTCGNSLILHQSTAASHNYINSPPFRSKRFFGNPTHPPAVPFGSYPIVGVYTWTIGQAFGPAYAPVPAPLPQAQRWTSPLARIYPDLLPILQPVEVPQAVPRSVAREATKAQNKRAAQGWPSTGEQGPEGWPQSQPRPRAGDVIPFPRPAPRHNPLGREIPLQSPANDPDAPGRISWDPARGRETGPAPGGNPSRPGPRTKERKFIATSNGRIMRLFNAVTEFDDLVDAFYFAIAHPTGGINGGRYTRFADSQGRVLFSKPKPTFWKDPLGKWHKNKVPLQDKVEYVWRHLNHINMNKAIRNLITNELSDRVYGKLGRVNARFNRVTGRFGQGPGTVQSHIPRPG